MPLNGETTGFTDDRDNLVGDEFSSKLLTLTGDRVLPLAPRSLIHLTMPPLASHVWRQLDYLRGKGNRLAGWLTPPILLPAFIPILGKPVTHSPAWWQRLHLIWLRQHQKRENEFLQAANVTGGERMVDGINLWAGEPYPNESPRTMRTPERKRIVTASGGLDSIVIKNLLSQPEMRVNPLGTIDDFLHQTYATSGHLPAEQVADEPEAGYAVGFTTSYIRQSKIPGIYQVNRIQKPDLRYIKHIADKLAQTNRQPQPAYQRRWLDKVWSPLIQRFVPYRMPMKRPSHITLSNIRGTYTTPLPHLSYLTITRARAEPGTEAARHATLPYMDNIAELITPGGEAIETVENYNRPVDPGTETNLPYYLPDQNEPAVLRAVLNRPSLPVITSITRNLKESAFNTLLPEPLVSSKDLDLLTTRTTLQRVPEISQAGWSAPLAKLWPEMAGQRAEAATTGEHSTIVTRSQAGWSAPLAKLWPEMAGQRAETTNISEDSGSVTHSPVTVTGATPDTVSLGQGLQTGETEMLLIHHEPLSVVGSRRPPLSVTESIYQTAALPSLQYFKSVGNAPSPDGSENYRFLWNQDYGPSSPRYSDAHQPPSELVRPSAVEPRVGVNTTHSEGMLSAIFEGTTYYGSQPTPELALAPVGRPAEEVSPSPARAEVTAEETTKEVAAPDIDAVARDVYSILKRRLTRERERALGLS